MNVSFIYSPNPKLVHRIILIIFQFYDELNGNLLKSILLLNIAYPKKQLVAAKNLYSVNVESCFWPVGVNESFLAIRLRTL